jgi:hypothetical protein
MSSKWNIPRMMVSDLFEKPTDKDLLCVPFLRCLRCYSKMWSLCVFGPNYEIVICNYCIGIDELLNVH